jgi:hypothetical protein
VIVISERYRRSPFSLGGRAAVVRGAIWGLVGGLIGTVALDIVLIAVLSTMGLPAVISFTTIGDTAAAFFGLVGLEMAGGFPMGVTAHYLLGLMLGAIFGAAVSQVEALRTCRRLRCVLLGVVYVLILSQPILALSPLLLKMTAVATVQWFVISAAVHSIWGAVLGAFVGFGLRRESAAGQG